MVMLNISRMESQFPGPYNWSVTGENQRAGGVCVEFEDTLHKAADVTRNFLLSGEIAPETEIKTEDGIRIFWQKIPIEHLGKLLNIPEKGAT